MTFIKLISTLLCFLFVPHLSYGQNGVQDSIKIEMGQMPLKEKDVAIQEASYKEGAEKFHQKLVEIYKPIHGLEAFFSRVGAISFTVMPNGTVTDVKVFYALSEKEDKKAVKFIKSTSGKWNPRTEKGISVQERVMLPINNW